jgi:CubicO group peptidase (beta-lactamase class C family)
MLIRQLGWVWLLCSSLVAGAVDGTNALPAVAEGTFPGEHWSRRSPSELGLDPAKLTALSVLVGGHGCVVRHGFLAFEWGNPAEPHDVASALKPLLTALVTLAVQEGRLKGFDQPVAEQVPALLTHDGGKNRAITWRHLCNQLSGYGLAEAPGEAFGYNDFAIALLYDTLMNKAYAQGGTEVLRSCLASPLQFEDPFTFEAFGPDDRPGRLAVSARDFARFGWLMACQGRWRGRQLMPADQVKLLTTSPIPPSTPLTTGKETPLLPGQRSIGGGRNITSVGPGYYSFCWWLNGTNRLGQRLFPPLPEDAFVASGHGGKRALWILPSLRMVVSWNETRVEDHDASPGNPKSLCNQAAALMREAVLDEASHP